MMGNKVLVYLCVRRENLLGCIHAFICIFCVITIVLGEFYLL